jgi:hypothetical protein
VAPITQKGVMIMKLLPSMLSATPAEVKAFRSQMRDRYTVPKSTPSRKADLAFEESADKIIAYLSSPIPSAPDPIGYGS